MRKQDQLEAGIRNQRQTEAIKKNYLGIEGKLAFIAMNLGEEIVLQSKSDQSFLEDPYATSPDIPVLDEDDLTYVLGWSYYGNNIQITLMEDYRKIVVNLNGITVYKEVAGELEAYIPSEEMDQRIDNLYPLAKEKEKKIKITRIEKAIRTGERKKGEWLREMKEKWGFMI